jgi:hypothetical protein
VYEWAWCDETFDLRACIDGHDRAYGGRDMEVM